MNIVNIIVFTYLFSYLIRTFSWGHHWFTDGSMVLSAAVVFCTTCVIFVEWLDQTS